VLSMSDTAFSRGEGLSLLAGSAVTDLHRGTKKPRREAGAGLVWEPRGKGGYHWWLNGDLRAMVATAGKKSPAGPSSMI